MADPTTNNTKQPQQPQQPRSIFECINMNVVDLSKDVVTIFEQVQSLTAKVDAIYNALFPQVQVAEPNASGAEKDTEE